jgi:hypothetical protein
MRAGAAAGMQSSADGGGRPHLRPLASSRATMTTVALARASMRAVWKPMPLFATVTMAT